MLGKIVGVGVQQVQTTRSCDTSASRVCHVIAPLKKEIQGPRTCQSKRSHDTPARSNVSCDLERHQGVRVWKEL